MDDGLVIIVLMMLSVIPIVVTHRFEVERVLRQKYGIDREWWLPVIGVIVFFL